MLIPDFIGISLSFWKYKINSLNIRSFDRRTDPQFVSVYCPPRRDARMPAIDSRFRLGGQARLEFFHSRWAPRQAIGLDGVFQKIPAIGSGA